MRGFATSLIPSESREGSAHHGHLLRCKGFRKTRAVLMS
jgi:hypothetical protein